jgi:hypothetical protein
LKRRRLIKWLDEIFFALPSEDRAHALIFAFERIGHDNLFWIALAKWWSGFDAIDHETLNDLMRRRAPAWTPDCMTKKNLHKYRALPDRLTIYRGQDMAGEIKFSWTLDARVAEGFARGHRGAKHPNPIIYVATTDKDNVALYQSERKEAEVVLFQRPKIDVAATRLR